DPWPSSLENQGCGGVGDVGMSRVVQPSASARVHRVYSSCTGGGTLSPYSRRRRADERCTLTKQPPRFTGRFNSCVALVHRASHVTRRVNFSILALSAGASLNHAAAPAGRRRGRGKNEALAADVSAGR